MQSKFSKIIPIVIMSFFMLGCSDDQSPTTAIPEPSTGEEMMMTSEGSTEDMGTSEGSSTGMEEELQYGDDCDPQNDKCGGALQCSPFHFKEALDSTGQVIDNGSKCVKPCSTQDECPEGLGCFGAVEGLPGSGGCHVSCIMSIPDTECELEDGESGICRIVKYVGMGASMACWVK